MLEYIAADCSDASFNLVTCLSCRSAADVPAFLHILASIDLLIEGDTVFKILNLLGTI